MDWETHAAHEADWLRDAYLEQLEPWEVEQDRDDDNGVDADGFWTRLPDDDPSYDDVPF
jgi:hypothetical protein